MARSSLVDEDLPGLGERPGTSLTSFLTIPVPHHLWIRVAGKVSYPGTRRLARLASVTTLFQTHHIPGKENIEADCLSRLVQGSVPSWAYVIKLCSRLETCQICLLPPELLSTLATILSSELTEATYEEELTTRLFTLEIVIFPVGSSPLDLESTVSQTPSPSSYRPHTSFFINPSRLCASSCRRRQLQSRPNLSDQTLQGYLSAARSDTISLLTSKPCALTWIRLPLPTNGQRLSP